MRDALNAQSYEGLQDGERGEEVMPIFHVLVKDYGREGLQVCGLTSKDSIAQAWESGAGENRRVEVDSEASLEATGYALSPRL